MCQMHKKSTTWMRVCKLVFIFSCFCFAFYTVGHFVSIIYIIFPWQILQGIFWLLKYSLCSPSRSDGSLQLRKELESVLCRHLHHLLQRHPFDLTDVLGRDTNVFWLISHLQSGQGTIVVSILIVIILSTILIKTN